jgi:hypothetical protein
MSSPIELLNTCELLALISLLKNEQVLPPDLKDVPSKLEAALHILMKGNSIVSRSYPI